MPTLSLSDGRRLGYETFGAPDGDPVFFFHGLPGSRLDGELLADAATSRDVTLVAPDRPGFGLSTFQPTRRLLDWPTDVTAVADELGFERFGVVGLSGGGPHAAACTHAVTGDRLTGVALVDSALPTSFADRNVLGRTVFGVLARFPTLVRPGFALVALQAKHRPESLRNGMRRQMATGDESVLADDAVWASLLASTREAFRQGTRGPAHDGAVLSRPWGFGPATLDGSVSLWHGAEDGSVPVADVERFAAAIPDADLTVFDGEGHLSPLVRHGETILDAVV
ncbi:alpha/beta fold hydrolase [Halogranum rubrum]|uniref:AB hydrolase-1 domain-containing protein n=1 Tax=Halogranum salarium B-1 TaxID=1210908 RepID=J2ZZ35_9EURY|nr:alpha/beta hydrolase [Halogranum salarium]EJN58288.1 hypothetical protein HSB1_37050 [Halogranum salarium B-1]